MRLSLKFAGGASAALAALVATALPAAAAYPPSANVRGRAVVAPDSTVAFTGTDLAPLVWAVTLLAVGVVLLAVARRTASPDR